MSFNGETFARVIKLGHTNFWRHRWLTIGAALLMTLTLTMITVSLLMTFLLRDTAENIRSKIDLTIYFRDDTVEDQKIIDLAARIKNQPNVLDVHFINKKEALEIWSRLPINENIKKPVTTENNPLPRSVQVDTANPDDIQAVVSVIEIADTGKLICGECVSYAQNKDTVNRLVSFTRFAQRTGLFLSLFFGIIAIFNVLNIIRITITARSDEIEIMRYVGASNMFIRGPFIVEGIMYGLFGTFLTTLFLLIIAAVGSRFISSSPGALSLFQIFNVDIFRYLLAHLTLLVAIQLIIGVVLGVIVSLFSIRRYLKA